MRRCGEDILLYKTVDSTEQAKELSISYITSSIILSCTIESANAQNASYQLPLSLPRLCTICTGFVNSPRENLFQLY
jgi:hypothetical protein